MRFTYRSLTSYTNYFHIKGHFTPIFSSVAFLFAFQVFIGDEGVATREGGTCVRGSEGLEDVAVVWLCLVRSLDRWLGFLVVDRIITSLARRFLLAPTVPP